MENVKPWWASKTIWVNLLQSLVGIGIAAGWLTEDQGTAITGQADLILGAGLTLLSAASALARIKATKQLTL